MTSRKYLVTIPEEEGSWLDSHPEICKSGVFLKAIKILMNKQSPILPTDHGDLEIELDKDK